MSQAFTTNDVVELAFVSRAGDQIGVNTRQFKVVSLPVGPITIEDLVTFYATLANTAYTALMSQFATLERISGQIVLPVRLAREDYAQNVAGGVVGDLMPTQVAGIANFRGSPASPANRGRTYMPFPSEADNTSAGVPQASYTGGLLTWANFFVGDVLVPPIGGGDTAVLQNVIWHRGAGTTTAIVTAGSRAGWGTQRKRGYFGRRNPII